MLAAQALALAAGFGHARHGFRSVQKNVESDSDQPFHDTRSATARLVTKAALLLLLLPRGLCPQTLLLLLLLLLGFRTRRVLRQR